MADRLIVWDFDGVLNANVVDGRFIWADSLDEDWGVSVTDLQAHVFEPVRLRSIIRGDVDLRDAIAEWSRRIGRDIDPDAFLAYWFAKDTHTDPAVLAHLKRSTFRHVIGTNNEARRAGYIESEMGFGDLVERIFASGRMGCAKPDTAFLEQIEAWSSLPPEAHVLVDDGAKNVAAAQARGWHAYHFTDHTRDGLGPFLDGLSL